MRSEFFIKIALAILLFLCLFDMPYGYYQFVRLSSFVIFGWLAFKANESGKEFGTIIYVGLAILFQPIIKVSLGRELWNVVDVVVGIGLLIGVFADKSGENNK